MSEDVSQNVHHLLGGIPNRLTINVTAADHDVSISSHESCLDFSQDKRHASRCKNGNTISDLSQRWRKTDIPSLGYDKTSIADLVVDCCPEKWMEDVAFVLCGFEVLVAEGLIVDHASAPGSIANTV
jgi:hypothetical protein